MNWIVDHWLPRPRICHPYSNQCLIATTQDKGRVRQPPMRGSMERVLGDWHSYSG